MIEEFELAHDELDTILYTSILIFLFPVSIFSKFVFSSLTNQSFNFTAANLIDLTCVILVAITWYVTNLYDTRDLEEPLFTPEEDKLTHVKFFGNLISDIRSDEFRYDYLLAAVTASLWVRCLVLLRLT
jgi:hypothetical protein